MTDEERAEQLREQLHEWIDDCFDNGEIDHQMWQESDYMHSWSHPDPVGVEVGPTKHTFEMLGDRVSMSINVEEIASGKMYVYDNDDDEDDDTLRLAAEDDWDDEECVVCGTDFDTRSWEKSGVAGDAWGGTAVYECPIPDCEGSATVNY